MRCESVRKTAEGFDWLVKYENISIPPEDEYNVPMMTIDRAWASS